MAPEIFVDTSGFYALLANRDDAHGQAKGILRLSAQTNRRFLTTDYVLDETATLLRARRIGHLAAPLFEVVAQSEVCRIEWMDSVRFESTRNMFLKYVGRDWSFTDCFSFQVMKQLRLREALTKDEHFRQAGFDALLAST